MKILFYDYETTGIKVCDNEILEIAACVVDDTDFKVIDTFNQYIKPKKPISYFITQLTSITNQDVASAKTEGIVLNEFMNFIKKHKPDAIAGHNIERFDNIWTKEKCDYYRITNQMPSTVIDTLPLAKDVFNNGLMPDYNFTTAKGNLSFKLENLMNYFELGVQEHRAISDVKYNIIVYKKLKELEENYDYGF